MLSEAVPSILAPFPADRVEACLREVLAAVAAEQAMLRPGGGASGGRGAWEPEVDSLVVLTVLTALHEHLGVELPDAAVPPGGYADAEACIGDLLGRARAVWDATHTGVLA